MSVTVTVDIRLDEEKMQILENVEPEMLTQIARAAVNDAFGRILRRALVEVVLGSATEPPRGLL